ncbi:MULTISPECIES: hypothetical protein [Streptomyces]|uniref:Uncharacterized protein n=1 Tax=Streptomyces doudnae TaxID=3075536 RepID=A0ABD5EXF3_9ACTN|nr:hypothetical protein [Streptomyces sp. DSM 41981]MDT0439412.1 hypothetical protein [Streptomyces sp. DSM 41981]SCE47743.1 hypothetical protein GA0115242_140119 [Streptomyces sp. SolWspMP-5a-2]
MKRLAPALALCALLVAALPAHAADQPAHWDSYGTKAPYAPGQSPRTYQAAPAGYVPVLTENVSGTAPAPPVTARTPIWSSRCGTAPTRAANSRARGGSSGWRCARCGPPWSGSASAS